jgi:hypothetical protein
VSSSSILCQTYTEVILLRKVSKFWIRGLRVNIFVSYLVSPALFRPALVTCTLANSAECLVQSSCLRPSFSLFILTLLRLTELKFSVV